MAGWHSDPAKEMMETDKHAHQNKIRKKAIQK